MPLDFMGSTPSPSGGPVSAWLVFVRDTRFIPFKKFLWGKKCINLLLGAHACLWNWSIIKAFTFSNFWSSRARYRHPKKGAWAILQCMYAMLPASRKHCKAILRNLRHPFLAAQKTKEQNSSEQISISYSVGLCKKTSTTQVKLLNRNLGRGHQNIYF